MAEGGINGKGSTSISKGGNWASGGALSQAQAE